VGCRNFGYKDHKISNIIKSGVFLMLTTISSRGKTSVPAEIRRKYGLKGNSKLQWIDEGSFITVIPIGAGPIASFRGKSKGKNLVEALLETRRRERKG